MWNKTPRFSFAIIAVRILYISKFLENGFSRECSCDCTFKSVSVCFLHGSLPWRAREPDQSSKLSMTKLSTTEFKGDWREGVFDCNVDNEVWRKSPQIQRKMGLKDADSALITAFF